MACFEKKAGEDAMQAIASMLNRSEQAQRKFAPGSSQHTLLRNRIHALTIASALIAGELAGSAKGGFTQEELAAARAPIASLISKSEKARTKLTPGSWQEAMLGGNLNALVMASTLLTKSLSSNGQSR